MAILFCSSGYVFIRMAFNLACMAFNPFGFQHSPYDPSYLPIWHVLFAHITHLFAHLAFFFLPIWHFFLAHLARSPPFDFTGKIENTTSPVTLSTSKIIAFQAKISLTNTFTSISFSAFSKLLRHRLTFHGSSYYTCIPYYTCSFATMLLQRLPVTISSHTYSAAPPPPGGGTTKPGSDTM